MNYFSDAKITATTSGYEGVTFRLRRFSEKIRAELRFRLASHLARVRELEAELEGLTDGSTSSCARQLREAEIEYELESIIRRDVDPVCVQALLLGVDGLHVDGREPDAQVLYESGPAELWQELVELVRGMAGFDEEQTKNFERLSTSNAAGGRPILATDVAAASRTDFISIATVQNISRSS